MNSANTEICEALLDWAIKAKPSTEEARAFAVHLGLPGKYGVDVAVYAAEREALRADTPRHVVNL